MVPESDLSLHIPHFQIAMSGLIRSAFAAAILMLIMVNQAIAAFVVNDIGDASDANPGDGVCDIPVGGPPRCTLRAAIEEANAFAGDDLIQFSIGLFTLKPTTALPTITTPMTIDATTAPGYPVGAGSVLDATPLVRVDGSALSGTTIDGLRVFNVPGATIRGLAIFGFPDNGIEIINSEAVDVDSNWIGVRHDGAAGSNGGAGVYLSDCSRCVIGTDVSYVGGPSIAGRGNLISANGEDGIYLQLGDDNQISGNYIGTQPAGGSAFGNARHGIYMAGGGNQVGLKINDYTSPNYIEYNGSDGIRTVAGNQRIYGNQIFANDGNGVSLNGANSELGDTVPGRTNLIGANGGHGVEIGGVHSASDGNLVESNWIYQNLQRGIELVAGNNNTIRINQIVDNDNDAIHLGDEGNTVEINDIGFLNDYMIGNAANGIVVTAGGNTLNTNRIGGMLDDGIDIVSGAGTTIVGNQVGASGDGTRFGNAAVGIRVRAAATGTQITNNIIGDNSDGILLHGASSAICGNRVGLGSSNENIGNRIEGMRVLGGGNTIGNTGGGCAANDIGFNASDGIQVHGDANIIRDNRIGGQPFVDLGNGRGGILLTDGAALNDVSGNLLWNNDDGIRVGGTASNGNRLEDNNFGGNFDLAIDLNDDGATPNDAGDVDSGPNNLQNYPVITSLSGSGGQLQVSYHIDSDIDRSTYPLQADFYFGNSGDGQGYRVHTDTYGLSPGSTRVITFDPPYNAGYLAVMTIDADGNSSELGPGLHFQIQPPVDELFKDRFEGP